MKKQQITILEAMDDPKLFGPWFRGSSWDAWKVFLAALFGLPLTDVEQAELYRKHTGRNAAPTKPFSEAWLDCGRRAGKSLIAALLAVFIALFRDYEGHLAPGELATVMVVAADRKQARVILRYVRGFVNKIPMLSQMVTRELKESIEFSNRTVIEIHTASYRTIRGYACAACINDEIAFWIGDEESAEPAGEIIAAERPALATLPGALLISLSSPHARRGPLWDAFKNHYGKDSNVFVWKTDSQSMNPKLDPAIVAEAYERDPIAAAAEYGAEFRSDCESFVSREAIEACTVKARFELPRVEGIRYFAFVDPSGGSADSFTLAIAHLRKQGPRVVLDLVREIKPPFSPEKVGGEFSAVLKSYRLDTVTGDAYAGEWPRERFLAYGISYRVSEKSRSDIYLELLPILNSSRAELLDNQRLLSQVSNLERHTARGGRETIDHPPGRHDDVANAAAGALTLAWCKGTMSDGGNPLLFVNGARTGNGPNEIPWNDPRHPRFWKSAGNLR